MESKPLPNVCETMESKPLPNAKTDKQKRSGHLMSSSLKERLKRCGRYHPASGSKPKSLSSPEVQDVPNCGQAQQIIGPKFCEKTINSKQDSTTPNRKILETYKSDASHKTLMFKRRNIFIENQLKEDVSAMMASGSVCQNELSDQEAGLNKPASPSQVKQAAAECEISMEGESSFEDCSPCVQNNLKDILEKLKVDLKEKEEHLRKLKMVQKYREKNDLTMLQGLINTWRDVSQRALLDLYELQPEPRSSVTDLIKHLQIDAELLNYNEENEGFS